MDFCSTFSVPLGTAYKEGGHPRLRQECFHIHSLPALPGGDLVLGGSCFCQQYLWRTHGGSCCQQALHCQVYSGTFCTGTPLSVSLETGSSCDLAFPWAM